MKLTKSFSISLLLSVIALINVNAQTMDSIKITLKNAGVEINSKYPDFAPVISADGDMMMFTSRRPVTEKEIKSGKATFERIFVSNHQAPSNTWSKPAVLGVTVNAEERNNSAI